MSRTRFPLSDKKIISLVSLSLALLLYLFSSNDTPFNFFGQTFLNQPSNSEDSILVARVVDGDTIKLENGETVRYIGIDTPETVKPNTPVQCFGEEASKKNKELVEGKRVRLVKDVSDRDRYGRLLRYVYVDDLFVNRALVEQGYAQVATFPPDVAYADQFRAAQTAARDQKRGLWSSCK